MPKKTANNKDNKNSKEKGSIKRKKTKESPLKQKTKFKIREKEKEKENIKKPKSIIENINPLQSNETIIRIIVDKIIAISVRKAVINSITNKLQDYYFDYLKTQVNTMFATNNIFYSDEPEDIIIDNSLFWKTDYDECNTWVEVKEPKSSKCDRFENAFMNYINIKNDLSSDNNDLSPKNGTDIKNSKKFKINLKNIKNNKNDLDILEEKSSIESKDEENKSIYKNINTPRKNYVLKPNNITNKNIKKNDNTSSFQPIKRPRNEVLEMPVHEIPGINEEYNYEKYEPANINYLRKEKEEQKIRKQKEQKKHMLYSQKNMKNNQNQEDIEEKAKETKKIKMFDSNKLTFDSNGKILLFKPLKIDILIKDFAIPKNAVKTFNARRRRSVFKKFTKKDEQINDALKDREKEKNNLINIENIIKNPVDTYNAAHTSQYKKSVSDKNNKVIPSGSNFSIMLPNIGVVLKENEKIKQGTREFGKYFKKYSLEDYDKILKDYVPLQNKTMMINKIGKVIKTPLNRSSSTNYLNNVNSNVNNNILSSLSINNNANNYNDNINNNSDISNPLLNQDKENESSQNDNINYNMNYNMNYENLLKTLRINKNSFNNNSFLSSYNKYNNLTMSRNNKNLSNISTGRFDGSIRLNKEGSSSLKMEIDSLQDLEFKNINSYYSPIRTGMKNVNIFGKNYKDIFKNMNKEKNVSKDLNEFNKKIITNMGWGSKTMRKNMSSGNLLYSKHQTKYQAIRELGSNLLNGIKVKLPRNRKINLNI